MPLMYITNDSFNFCYNVNNKFNSFVNVIHCLIDQFIPKRFFSSKSKINYPPHIKKILKQKTDLYHSLKVYPNLIKAYTQISKTAKFLIKNHHRLKTQNLLSDPTKFHKFIQKTLKPSETIPALCINDVFFSDPIKKCELFADSFQKSFQNVPTHTPPPLINYTQKEFLILLILLFLQFKQYSNNYPIKRGDPFSEFSKVNVFKLAPKVR